MKFDNRNLHNNVVIVFKQLKTVQKVYFSYLEAGDIGNYFSFRISEDSELEKWPNYPELPYSFPRKSNIIAQNKLKRMIRYKSP